eukprot:1001972_1
MMIVDINLMLINIRLYFGRFGIFVLLLVLLNLYRIYLNLILILLVVLHHLNQLFDLQINIHVRRIFPLYDECVCCDGGGLFIRIRVYDVVIGYVLIQMQ